MGIVERFIARGGSPTAVNINIGARRLVQLRFLASGTESGREAFAPKAIMIPQSETEEILGGLLWERGGQIEWETEFLGYRENAETVVCRARHRDDAEEQITSKWLVSCEGAHSVARQQAGITLTGKTYPLAFFLADVELDGPLTHGENHVWLHADGSFAALPFAQPRAWRLFIDVTKSHLPQGELSLGVIKDLMTERTGERGMTISNPTWISEFRIHCRMVDRYRCGRVLLAGDAAHIHSPTGGQGIVTGIQDVTNVAWKLARVLRGAPEALLDTYEEERLPKAREVLNETDRTTRLLLAPRLVTRLFRDLVLLPIMRMAWIQRKLFSKLAQLHVNYRGSSLSQHEATAPGRPRVFLKAGDRAPDVCFENCRSGGKVTLFELLEPMRPVALIGVAEPNAFQSNRVAGLFAEADVAAYFLVPESAPQVVAEYLRDLHGDFRRLYGMTGEFLCLIRPDDHIGLFQQPINERSLRQYLAKLASRNSSAAAASLA